MGVVREFSHFLIGPACGANSLFFSEKRGIFSLHQWVFGFRVTICLRRPHFLSRFAILPPTQVHAWDSFQLKVIHRGLPQVILSMICIYKSKCRSSTKTPN